MREITKEEIKLVLLQNNNFIHDFTQSKNASAKEIAFLYAIDLKYNCEILNILSFIKLLSYYKDRNFENLKEEEIKFNFDNIFYDKEERKQFTKKQIIGLIRNALCHNDTNNYKLIKDNDEIYIEIDMYTKANEHVHVKLNTTDIYTMIISLILSNNIKTGRYTHEVNPRKFRYKNYGKAAKTNFYLIKEKELNNEKRNDIVNKSTAEILKEKKINISQETITLKQKKCIDSVLRVIRKCMDKKINELSDEAINDILQPYLWFATDNTIPDGLYKDYNILMNIIIYSELSNNPEKSYLDIINTVKLLQEKEVPKGYYSPSLNLLKLYKDKLFPYVTFEEFRHTNFMIWFSYIIENTTENQITIGNKTYERNRLRNSLTHGRWHINYETAIVTLYDYSKEYDYKFEEDIDYVAIYNYIYENTFDLKKKLS